MELKETHQYRYSNSFNKFKPPFALILHLDPAKSMELNDTHQYQIQPKMTILPGDVRYWTFIPVQFFDVEQLYRYNCSIQNNQAFIFSINLSDGFTPIHHLDPAKSPWNSRKLITFARVIFSINLSHGFTPMPQMDTAKSP